MNYKIINRGNEKTQMKGYNGRSDGPKKFVKNPGGAEIVVHFDGGGTQTRHLQFRNGVWSDVQGNRYNLDNKGAEKAAG